MKFFVNFPDLNGEQIKNSFGYLFIQISFDINGNQITDLQTLVLVNIAYGIIVIFFVGMFISLFYFIISRFK